MLVKKFNVKNPFTKIDEQYIESQYISKKNEVYIETEGVAGITTQEKKYMFRVARKVPKLGVMIIGLGGNNGSTLVGACLANRKKISWKTRQGIKCANYYGSYTQSGTIHLADDVYAPVSCILPMVDPNEIVIGGWDINKANLAEAMARAQVLEPDLQRQLEPFMKEIYPLPSIYHPDFIALNQKERADNVLQGTNSELITILRQNMKDFKKKNNLDKVIVLWSANTERFTKLIPGVHDTADNLLKAIDENNQHISPSTLFAVASILEGNTYINGSPQNTFVPGVIELAIRQQVSIAGDDFKTGQTRLKSVLVDFLVSIGIKPRSIVSYNHLGNNDGKNLSAPQQFRSKEISKASVVDDVLSSNEILYPEGEGVDHVIVIKYVPYVGDSKRAIDEYCSEIFMGGENVISIYNLCEDSLLAVPIMLDLLVIGELCDRIQWKTEEMEQFERFHVVTSFLSLFLKAPLVAEEGKVINVFYKQRLGIENLLRVCAGLSIEDYLVLENKCICEETHQVYEHKAAI